MPCQPNVIGLLFGDVESVRCKETGLAFAAKRGSTLNSNVSVIIPVYNSLPHLDRCLRTVLSQTLMPAQIICVDDCSVDGSAEAVEGYARDNACLELVRHERNKGVSAARNTGLLRAKGKYVLFVDADDFVDERLLQLVVQKATNFSAQMVIFGHDEYYEANDSYIPMQVYEDSSLDNRSFSLMDMTLPSTELVTPNVWRILYEKRFLDDRGVLFHEELKTAEDLAFIYETMPYAERICNVPIRLYHYRRDGGATLTRGERGSSGMRALEYIRDGLEANGASKRLKFHFVNLVLDTTEYSLRTASTSREFSDLYERLSNEWIPYVADNGTLVARRYLRFYESVRSQTCMEYLFALFSGERSELERERAASAERDGLLERETRGRLGAEEECNRLRRTWAFRIGRALTVIPSMIRSRIASAPGNWVN